MTLRGWRTESHLHQVIVHVHLNYNSTEVHRLLHR